MSSYQNLNLTLYRSSKNTRTSYESTQRTSSQSGMTLSCICRGQKFFGTWDILSLRLRTHIKLSFYVKLAWIRAVAQNWERRFEFTTGCSHGWLTRARYVQQPFIPVLSDRAKQNPKPLWHPQINQEFAVNIIKNGISEDLKICQKVAWVNPLRLR